MATSTWPERNARNGVWDRWTKLSATGNANSTLADERFSTEDRGLLLRSQRASIVQGHEFGVSRHDSVPRSFSHNIVDPSNHDSMGQLHGQVELSTISPPPPTGRRSINKDDGMVDTTYKLPTIEIDANLREWRRYVNSCLDSERRCSLRLGRDPRVPQEGKLVCSSVRRLNSSERREGKALEKLDVEFEAAGTLRSGTVTLHLCRPVGTAKWTIERSLLDVSEYNRMVLEPPDAADPTYHSRIEPADYDGRPVRADYYRPRYSDSREEDYRTSKAKASPQREIETGYSPSQRGKKDRPVERSSDAVNERPRRLAKSSGSDHREDPSYTTRTVHDGRRISFEQHHKFFNSKNVPLGPKGWREDQALRNDCRETGTAQEPRLSTIFRPTGTSRQVSPGRPAASNSATPAASEKEVIPNEVRRPKTPIARAQGSTDSGQQAEVWSVGARASLDPASPSPVTPSDISSTSAWHFRTQCAKCLKDGRVASEALIQCATCLRRFHDICWMQISQDRGPVRQCRRCRREKRPISNGPKPITTLQEPTETSNAKSPPHRQGDNLSAGVVTEVASEKPDPYSVVPLPSGIHTTSADAVTSSQAPQKEDTIPADPSISQTGISNVAENLASSRASHLWEGRDTPNGLVEKSPPTLPDSRARSILTNGNIDSLAPPAGEANLEVPHLRNPPGLAGLVNIQKATNEEGQNSTFGLTDGTSTIHGQAAGEPGQEKAADRKSEAEGEPKTARVLQASSLAGDVFGLDRRPLAALPKTKPLETPASPPEEHYSTSPEPLDVSMENSQPPSVRSPHESAQSPHAPEPSQKQIGGMTSGSFTSAPSGHSEANVLDRDPVNVGGLVNERTAGGCSGCGRGTPELKRGYNLCNVCCERREKLSDDRSEDTSLVQMVQTSASTAQMAMEGGGQTPESQNKMPQPVEGSTERSRSVQLNQNGFDEMSSQPNREDSPKRASQTAASPKSSFRSQVESGQASSMPTPSSGSFSMEPNSSGAQKSRLGSSRKQVGPYRFPTMRRQVSSGSDVQSSVAASTVSPILECNSIANSKSDGSGKTNPAENGDTALGQHVECPDSGIYCPGNCQNCNKQMQRAPNSLLSTQRQNRSKSPKAYLDKGSNIHVSQSDILVGPTLPSIPAGSKLSGRGRKPCAECTKRHRKCTHYSTLMGEEASQVARAAVQDQSSAPASSTERSNVAGAGEEGQPKEIQSLPGTLRKPKTFSWAELIGMALYNGGEKLRRVNIVEWIKAQDFAHLPPKWDTSSSIGSILSQYNRLLWVRDEGDKIRAYYRLTFKGKEKFAAYNPAEGRRLISLDKGHATQNASDAPIHPGRGPEENLNAKGYRAGTGKGTTVTSRPISTSHKVQEATAVPVAAPVEDIDGVDLSSRSDVERRPAQKRRRLHSPLGDEDVAMVDLGSLGDRRPVRKRQRSRSLSSDEENAGMNDVGHILELRPARKRHRSRRMLSSETDASSCRARSNELCTDADGVAQHFHDIFSVARPVRETEWWDANDMFDAWSDEELEDPFDSIDGGEWDMRVEQRIREQEKPGWVVTKDFFSLVPERNPAWLLADANGQADDTVGLSWIKRRKEHLSKKVRMAEKRDHDLYGINDADSDGSEDLDGCITISSLKDIEHLLVREP